MNAQPVLNIVPDTTPADEFRIAAHAEDLPRMAELLEEGASIYDLNGEGNLSPTVKDFLERRAHFNG